MGMTIDADKFLAHLIWSGLIDKATCGEVTKAVELCRVETIPKDQYETRLKADLKAMLTEIQLEIEEHQESILGRYDNTVPERDKPMMKLARNEGRKECKNLIQQKINSLKEDI